MSRREFQTLNGLRGIAAIFVVIYHFPKDFKWHPQHAYLAVDLFFVISGFILSHVYGEALRTGLPTGKFMKRRVVRLAPLYWLGLLLSVAVTAMNPAADLRHLSLPILATYALFGLFLIPSHFRADPSTNVFAYNNPSWSLFLELVVNLVHALFLRRLKTGALAAVNVLSAVGLLAYGLHDHTNTMNFGFD